MTLNGTSSGVNKAVERADYARHVGRVGALAVAPGIGIAITNNTGVAVADTTGSSSTPSSSTSSAGQAKSPRPSAAESTTNTTNTPRKARTATAPSSTTSEGVSADTVDEDEEADGDAEASQVEHDDSTQPGRDIEDITEVDGTGPEDSELPDPPTAIGDVDPDTDPAQPHPVVIPKTTPKSSDTPDRGYGGEANSAPVDDSAPVAAAKPRTRVMTARVATAPASLAEQTVIVENSVAAAPTPAAVSAAAPAAAAVTAVPAAAGPLQAVLSGVSNWITGLTKSMNSPVAPPATPTVWALLGWVRRQLEYTFFNASPTINYQPSTNISGFNPNTQLFNGIVVGDLGLHDADGDKMTVKVTKLPSGGTVTINPNGTFTYVPNPLNAAKGFVDTFQVKVGDSVGNPAHINLLKLFSPNFGHTATKTIQITVLPTSPLGTPDQIAMEVRAKEIMETTQMKAAMATVRAQWLAAAQDGMSKAGGVDAVNMALLDQAVYEYFYAGALNAQNSDPLNPKVLTYDVAPHTWFGQDIPGSRVIYDNPDGIYRTIPVEINSSYVIRGQFFGTKPSDTNFSLLNVRGQTLANLAQKDIVVNEDGTFVITVSAAASDDPNHIQIAEGATNFLIRDTLSDWNTELPMSLTVERVGGAIVTPLTNEQLAEKAVAQLLAASPGFNVYMRAATRLNAFDPDSPLRDPNVFGQPAPFGDQTLVTQWPSYGYFQLRDDQALVLTIDAGSADYWVIPVSNDWETTNNYAGQQTTLNNTQAIANADGTYTVVLSPSDPRVANWISTGTVMVDLDGDGVTEETTVQQGTIQIRFQQITDAANGPRIVSQQVVGLDELEALLPEGTVFLTPEQRAEQLAEREAGYDASRWASPGNFMGV
ncbi:DUF1214 domain-containing protein [Mycobacterium sp. AMU20-3851]|uniref:Ig-like domain-containing protein n=1 Tax=Mycobacterium sp. AMU20-3851 TaxID=3122055 RepID=UPI003754A51E